jgi:hypothetical protein
MKYGSKHIQVWQTWIKFKTLQNVCTVYIWHIHPADCFRLKIHKLRLLKQCKTGLTAKRIQKHIYYYFFICGKNVLVYIDS